MAIAASLLPNGQAAQEAGVHDAGLERLPVDATLELELERVGVAVVQVLEVDLVHRPADTGLGVDALPLVDVEVDPVARARVGRRQDLLGVRAAQPRAVRVRD